MDASPRLSGTPSPPLSLPPHRCQQCLACFVMRTRGMGVQKATSLSNQIISTPPLPSPESGQLGVILAALPAIWEGFTRLCLIFPSWLQSKLPSKLVLDGSSASGLIPPPSIRWPMPPGASCSLHLYTWPPTYTSIYLRESPARCHCIEASRLGAVAFKPIPNLLLTLHYYSKINTAIWISKQAVLAASSLRVDYCIRTGQETKTSPHFDLDSFIVHE